MSQRRRLAEVEEALAKTQQAIDIRRAKSIAEFCKKHSLQVRWPSKTTAGTIVLPALSIDGTELEKIVNATVTSIFTDTDAGSEAGVEKNRSVPRRPARGTGLRRPLYPPPRFRPTRAPDASGSANAKMFRIRCAPAGQRWR